MVDDAKNGNTYFLTSPFSWNHLANLDETLLERSLVGPAEPPTFKDGHGYTKNRNFLK